MELKLKKEVREKELNYTQKAAVSTMVFSFILALLIILGRVFKFLVVPSILVMLAIIVFVFGYGLYHLTKRKIYLRLMPYLVLTVTTLVLSFALGFVSPQLRTPFFLIYFYIALHPAFVLSASHGFYSMILIDVAYLAMFFLTKSAYPDANLRLESIKLFFFTFISYLLTIEFDRSRRRLRRVRELLAKAEQGNLSGRISDVEKDEVFFLGESLNELLQTESNVIKTIIETSQSLVDTSAQIAATATELASSISEIVQTTHQITEAINLQYTELDKTTTASMELSEVSFDVVKNVKKIENFSTNVAEKAFTSLNQSDIVVKNIELISERYEALITLLNRLENISPTITKIVGTINAISEKITILSLNAAIEAARAGEYGRGFSIVADEVKKLADNTQSSAMEIARIITEMADSIKGIVESSTEVRQAITSGTGEIKSTTASLKEISNRILELDEAIKNIKGLIANQEKHRTDIVTQVEKSYKISKENAASAEQILASLQEQSATTEEFSATSQQLAALSLKLKELTMTFTI